MEESTVTNLSIFENGNVAVKLAEQYPLGAYWRIKEITYSSVDEYGDVIPRSSRVVLQLRPYEVLKRTDKGARIADYRPKGRWIANAWNKHWACATIDEAVASFRARKHRQISIYKGRISKIEAALRKLEGDPCNALG